MIPQRSVIQKELLDGSVSVYKLLEHDQYDINTSLSVKENNVSNNGHVFDVCVSCDDSAWNREIILSINGEEHHIMTNELPVNKEFTVNDKSANKIEIFVKGIIKNEPKETITLSS